MRDIDSGADLPFFKADLPTEGALARGCVCTVLSAGDLVARVLLLPPTALAADAVLFLTVVCIPISAEAALLDLCWVDVIFRTGSADVLCGTFKVFAGVTDLILRDLLAVEAVLFRSSADDSGKSNISDSAAFFLFAVGTRGLFAASRNVLGSATLAC